MDSKGFKEWRERFQLTQEQVAQKFNVSRTTVQNWEGGATPITPALAMGCQIWEHRLMQEDSQRGPVTLIYADGPMFISPEGPRRPLAMMQQEPYLTNAAAVARVQKRWKDQDFYNPFIIEESGRSLWNIAELSRVMEGDDTGAPTLANMLRMIAGDARMPQAAIPVSGRKMLSAAEKAERQSKLDAIASEIEALADQAAKGDDVRRQVETAFAALRALGKYLPDHLVTGVAQALWAYWEAG